MLFCGCLCFGKISAHTPPILNVGVRVNVRFKIKIRVRVKDRVRVGMVLRLECCSLYQYSEEVQAKIVPLLLFWCVWGVLVFLLLGFFEGGWWLCHVYTYNLTIRNIYSEWRFMP